MLDRVATPEVDAAPAPVLDKGALDRRQIQRKLLRNWDVVFNMLVSRNGKSLIATLNPNHKPNPENYVRRGEPRIVEFWGPDHREDTLGAWCNRGGDCAKGSSLFELVMYLGQCDMRPRPHFSWICLIDLWICQNDLRYTH